MKKKDPIVIYHLDALKGLKPGQQTQRSKRKSSSFQNTLVDATSSSTKPQEAAGLSGLTSIQTLIASYTEGTDETSDATLTQSRSMLDHLDRLRDGLLTGRYTYAELAQLKKSLDQSTSLGEVGQAIRLRVAVEIEKLQRLKTSA